MGLSLLDLEKGCCIKLIGLRRRVLDSASWTQKKKSLYLRPRVGEVKDNKDVYICVTGVACIGSLKFVSNAACTSP